MGKFSKLAAKVDKAFVQEIVSPFTGEPLKDKNGKVSFVEVYSADSQIGRKYDKDQRSAFNKQVRAGDVDVPDQLEQNIAKCAALTKSWHIVDPATLEPIDEPCTRENAIELYTIPGPSTYIYIPAWVAANKIANFMQRPSKTSSDTGESSGEKAEG